jgi:hypothetical protein
MCRETSGELTRPESAVGEAADRVTTRKGQISGAAAPGGTRVRERVVDARKDEHGPRRKVTGGAGFVTASDQAPSHADRQERPTSADTTYLRRRGNAEACARRGFTCTTGRAREWSLRRRTNNRCGLQERLAAPRHAYGRGCARAPVPPASMTITRPRTSAAPPPVEAPRRERRTRGRGARIHRLRREAQSTPKRLRAGVSEVGRRSA